MGEEAGLRGVVLAWRRRSALPAEAPSSWVPSAPWPPLCAFPGLQGPGLPRPPGPQGLCHKAIAGHHRPPPSASSLLHAPLSLPARHFSGPAGVGAGLGTAGWHGHTGRHASGRPTRLRAQPHAGPAPAAQPAPPRLPPRALLSPEPLTKTASLAPSPQASVAPALPHPHKVLGRLPPAARPSVLPESSRRPRTRTRAQVPVNAQGERVPGGLGRYLKDRRPGLFHSEGKERGAGQTPPAEAASCSRHPRLSQAVVLNEQ